MIVKSIISKVDLIIIYYLLVLLTIVPYNFSCLYYKTQTNTIIICK